MGAAASLVERAWRVRRGRDDLLVLTRAEVAEDEACLAAQRFYQVECCGVNLEWTAARFFRAYPWVWQLILALLGVRARSAGPGRTAHGSAAV